MLVLDIGSNDGCLLSYFAAAGFRVIGVDPAKNLAVEANARGIDTINAYWGDARLVDTILATRGQPSIVAATNVLAHVDDIHAFLHCVASVLDSDGLFVFEVPYLVDLIEKCEFDTIYHEHLSYFLLSPLRQALAEHSLQIVDVEHKPIHGGTVRIYAAKPGSGYMPSCALETFLEAEKVKGFHAFDVYYQFAQRVECTKIQMRALVSELKSKNLRIAGYGASAKGNTLLNYCEIDHSILDYIVDDNPKKHGYYTPGSHIPIIAPSRLFVDHPDYLLLLAWNFAEEIRQRTATYRQAGGRYIVPVPEVLVLEE